MDKTAAKRQRTRRAKLKLDGLRLVRIPLGRDTMAALDRLKTAHGTRQAAIEHAIRSAIPDVGQHVPQGYLTQSMGTRIIIEQPVTNQDK